MPVIVCNCSNRLNLRRLTSPGQNGSTRKEIAYFTPAARSITLLASAVRKWASDREGSG